MTGAKTNERPGTRAQVRYLRMSASKARVVLDLIRGKSVTDGRTSVNVTELEGAPRVQEVARLLGGDETVTADGGASRVAYAQQLLGEARSAAGEG